MTVTLLARDEAAAYVRLHPRTLLLKTQQGKIQCFQSGNKKLYSHEQLDAYLRDGESKTAKPTRNPNRSRRSN